MKMAFLGVLLELAGAEHAATGLNTVPASSAGDGTNTISAYEVNMRSTVYTLSTTDPQQISNVSINFSRSTVPTGSSTVQARLSSGSAWYVCSLSGSRWMHATTSPQATVTSPMSVTVVATN